MSLLEESTTFMQQRLVGDPLGRTVKSQMSTLALIQINLAIQIRAALALATTIKFQAHDFELLNTVEGAQFTDGPFVTIQEHIADLDANNEALRQALNAAEHPE